MSEEPQTGKRQPSPASQPSLGQDLVPERFPYIPGQENTLQYSQPNVRPQHHYHPTVSQLPAEGVLRLPGPLPPPPINLHNLSIPPPHYPGHPTPMFSGPPPPVPPRFSQPPPALPHTPNIPNEAAFQVPTMTSSMESSLNWNQHNTPPIPQYPQVLGHGLNTSSYKEEEEDLKWLKEFEKQVMSCQSLPPSPFRESTTTTTTTTREDVKLAEVQRLVQEAHSLMEQLSGLEKELNSVSSSANEEEWEKLVKQAEEIKFNLNQTLKNFQDPKFVERTKTLLKQRRAKRNRVKQRKKEKKLEKEQERREREEKETKIDAWRTKLQREEESKRREEAVKREADSILGEVRQKQNEAQKMLQLVEALTVLRQIRATKAAAEGQPKDTQAEERFTTTIGLITEAVKKQQKEYKLEEQTLRVMMEESATYRSAALSVKGDATFARFQDSVKKLLFGSAATCEDADLSKEMLVQRRQEWDQFVVEDDSLLASAVPLSWVLPPSQPDPDWAAFLRS